MKLNIFTLPTSPPRARTLYLVALCIAVLISAFAAYSFDVFRKELHPDPTRGSIKESLIVFLGLISFCLAVGTLVIGRWALWPRARTAFWHVHAAVFAAVGTYVFLSLLIPVLILRYQGPNGGWTEIESTPLPIGMAEPYFPSSFQRLEWFDESMQAADFREFAIEGSTVYQREGYIGTSSVVGTSGLVEKRIFPTEEEAYKETQLLIRKLQRDGYRLMPAPSTERPAS